MQSCETQTCSLESAYDVPREKIQDFRRRGHVLLREVLTAHEVNAWRPVIAQGVARRREQARGGVYQTSLGQRTTYDKAFVQIENLWQTDPQVRPFVLARRLAGIAADLLGAPAVRIYHDQALFKEPGGGYTPWHQDQYYWPLETEKTVTLWMPLVDMGAEMGTLIFADGTHRQGPLGDLSISDASEQFYKDYTRREGLNLTINELRAGDATFHYGWTLHKTPGNTTDRMREAMTIIYYADGARVMPPRNEKQQHDLERWLGGVAPGQPADSPSNPRIGGED